MSAWICWGFHAAPWKGREFGVILVTSLMEPDEEDIFREVQAFTTHLGVCGLQCVVTKEE